MQTLKIFVQMSTEGNRGAMLWETTVNQDGHTGVQWRYFWKGWLQDGTLSPEQVELRAQARAKQRHVTQRRVHAQRILAQGGYGGVWGPRQREVLAELGDEAVSEALADRIVQLTRIPQVVASVTGDEKGRTSLDYQWEAWWGQWQCLGDIVFHGVEAGLIDIDKLAKRIIRRGVQDNAVIWIIGQCTLLDKMKTLSTHDLISGLMSATIKFFNDKQCEDGMLFEPREVPLVWLWGRPSAALNAEIKKHAAKQIEKHIHHISELYKQLFQDIKQSGNFRKIDVTLQNKICAFSSQGFQQVFNLFESNLKIDIEHHQTALRTALAQLPPNVTTYSPPVAALPATLYSTSFLATLALRCRYRLINMFESTIGNVQLDAVPLSALETYARLVYYLPSQSHQTLLEHYYKAEGSRLHMLTELFTHRLYRFMLSQDMHDHLLNHVLRHLAVTTHVQNYDSLQVLALRLATHLHDPYYFKKRNKMVSVPEPLNEDARQDYGEPVNRMLTLALARTIKLRGLRDVQHVSELHAHLSQLHHLTGHVWPVETCALFPKVVQSFYQDKARVYLPTNSDRVNEELRLVMSLNETQLREYFSKEEKQLYLLPILLRAHPVITPGTVLLLNKLHVNELMHAITPQRWSKLSYWLVDYVLDTLTADQLASGEVNGEQLELTAQKLGHLIWDHAVLSLHTVLMALADSLVLPRALDTQHNAAVNRFNTAIQLIEHLLCKEPTILACRDAFTALQPNVDHWREDEPHKLRELLAKFPGRYVRTASNTPMSSYFGNTYLNLLPVLDYLIGRLIEVDQTDFLNYLMEYYSTLYRYHPAALTFLYETLFYYYDAPAFSSVRPDTSGKLIFFQLLVQSKVSFTSHLLHQFLQNMSEIDLTEQYFNDLLATLHIIDQGAEASVWSAFEELGGVNTVQHQYTCAAIELMAVTNAANPRTPLWIFTPQQLVQWPKQLGKLFAVLPRAFQDEFERQLVLYHRSIRDSLLNGCSWAWRWQEASSIDHVTFLVPVHSSVAHSDSTVSNLATVSMSTGTTEERVLWLVHSYYSLASPDTLLNYVTILRQIRDVDPMSQRANQPINSVAHLLLLVKSIAPYLPVLAKTPDQEYLQAVLIELLACFNDAEHFMDSIFAAGYTADRDNELLDIIIDFFAHCKAALQLTAPVIEAMRGVIRGLNIELRRRFKGI